MLKPRAIVATMIVAVGGLAAAAAALNRPAPSGGQFQTAASTATIPSPSVPGNAVAMLKAPAQPRPATGTLPPPAEALAALPEPLRALAADVANRLKDGPSAEACAGAERGLIGMLRGSPVDSALWAWGMNRARDCLRAPTAFRAKNGLLSALIDSFPDHPRVRELSGLQQYDAGDMDAAAESLEDAAPETNTFEAWETYADAQLARARQLQAAGDPRWQEALARAENGAMRALELADAFMRPFALHTVARTQIEMGRAAEAVGWANQAVEAVRAGGSRYQAVMTAEFYVFAGQIYFRAGQRDTGLAYMDQGIGMAPRADQQAQLRNIRDQFLRMYGSA